MRFRETGKTYGIDLDADPVYVPSGFEVIEHRKGGFLVGLRISRRSSCI